MGFTPNGLYLSLGAIDDWGGVGGTGLIVVVGPQNTGGFQPPRPLDLALWRHYSISKKYENK